MSRKDEIIESYGTIAEIVGTDILQKLIPSQTPQSTDTPSTLRYINPLVFRFNVLLIKLLAVATLGRETNGVDDMSFMQVDSDLRNQLAASDIRVIIIGQKKEVELFRDKALSTQIVCAVG